LATATICDSDSGAAIISQSVSDSNSQSLSQTHMVSIDLIGVSDTSLSLYGF